MIVSLYNYVVIFNNRTSVKSNRFDHYCAPNFLLLHSLPKQTDIPTTLQSPLESEKF